MDIYFFVTDKIKDKELSVVYCPTEDIVADLYIKPLQGSQFQKHRNTILGIAVGKISTYMTEYDNLIKSLNICIIDTFYVFYKNAT